MNTILSHYTVPSGLLFNSIQFFIGTEAHIIYNNIINSLKYVLYRYKIY